MRLKILIPFFFLLNSWPYKSMDQEYQKILILNSGNKSKKIKFNNALTIYSVEGETAGGFRYADSSSLYLSPYYQKDKNGKTKFFSEKTDSIIQVNFTDIIKFEKERSTLGSIAAVTVWVALGSAFIVSPILSIEKGSFNVKKCLAISGASLGTAVISAAIIGIFADKMFYFTPNPNNRRIWKIKN